MCVCVPVCLVCVCTDIWLYIIHWWYGHMHIVLYCKKLNTHENGDLKMCHIKIPALCISRVMLWWLFWRFYSHIPIIYVWLRISYTSFDTVVTMISSHSGQTSSYCLPRLLDLDYKCSYKCVSLPFEPPLGYYWVILLIKSYCWHQPQFVYMYIVFLVYKYSIHRHMLRIYVHICTWFNCIRSCYVAGNSYTTCSAYVIIMV